MQDVRNQIASLQSDMRTEFAEIKDGINRLESAAVGIRRDGAGTAEDIAQQQAPIDRIKERLDCIERRRELREDFRG